MSFKGRYRLIRLKYMRNVPHHLLHVFQVLSDAGQPVIHGCGKCRLIPPHLIHLLHDAGQLVIHGCVKHHLLHVVQLSKDVVQPAIQGSGKHHLVLLFQLLRDAVQRLIHGWYHLLHLSQMFRDAGQLVTHGRGKHCHLLHLFQLLRDVILYVVQFLDHSFVVVLNLGLRSANADNEVLHNGLKCTTQLKIEVPDRHLHQIARLGRHCLGLLCLGQQSYSIFLIGVRADECWWMKRGTLSD